jgi:monovalent cation/proton antiporter MnhG/PhaG subunit
MGMSWRSLAEAFLLIVGVVATLWSCLGILVAPGLFARLHYLSALSTVGPAAIVGAVVVRYALSATGIKAMVVLAVVLVTSPVLTHAIAYAGRLRRRGGLDIRVDERVGT